MKQLVFTVLFISPTLCLFSQPRQETRPPAVQSASSQYRLIFENPATLAEVKKTLGDGSRKYSAALKQLIQDADASLRIAPLSVMEKAQLPPSGDKHDYMSLARYFWPNPKNTNGLPYIMRDGEVNPEIHTITDYGNFGKMLDSVHTLAMAYYFTGHEKYAEHAAKMIRVWFLDPDTKMNPNLNFAQAVKGLNTGRPTGLIETREIGLVADAVGLMAGSKAWTAEDQKGLEDWFAKYLDWLLTSPNGREESKKSNNHGLWFDVQITSVALFAGREDAARKILEEAKNNRIGIQIEPDGSMPLELARTTSKHYIRFTLEGFFRLASIGERVGVDLWNYETKDGRSLQKALEYPIPYILGKKEWQYKQIHDFQWNLYYPLYLQGSIVYKNAKYDDLLKVLSSEETEKSRLHLIFGR
jgi:hypothetical protein